MHAKCACGRYEGGVGVENDFLHRGIASEKLVDVLIYVEYHSNGDNEEDGEEISTEELTNDISVEPIHWRVLGKPLAEALPCLAFLAFLPSFFPEYIFQIHTTHTFHFSQTS